MTGETGEPVTAGPGAGGVIIYQSDGRYARVPHCNKRCGEDGHWLEAGRQADAGREPSGGPGGEAFNPAWRAEP